MEFALGFRDFSFFLCIFFQAIMKTWVCFVRFTFFFSLVECQCICQFQQCWNQSWESSTWSILCFLQKNNMDCDFWLLCFCPLFRLCFYLCILHIMFMHIRAFQVFFITIFNDLNFSTFDDLDLLIAMLNDFNLLAFSQSRSSTLGTLYIYIFCGFLFLSSFFTLCFCFHWNLHCVYVYALFKCFKNSFQRYWSFNFQQSWYFKLVVVEEKDVCLVEFIW